MSSKLYAEAKKREGAIANFLKDIVSIPSLSSQEGDVVKFMAAAMKKMGYDEVVNILSLGSNWVRYAVEGVAPNGASNTYTFSFVAPAKNGPITMWIAGMSASGSGTGGDGGRGATPGGPAAGSTGPIPAAVSASPTAARSPSPAAPRSAPPRCSSRAGGVRAS